MLYEALIHGQGTPLLLAAYAMGLLAVFFTGFYTFRMVFLTFHGKPRTDTAEDPHGVRWNVKFPLVVLGTLAAVAGFINMAPVAKATGTHIDYLHQWLNGPEEAAALTAHHYGELLENPMFAGYDPAGTAPYLPALVSLAIALAGVALAYRLYAVPEPTEHTDKLGWLKTLWFNNYYQDEYQVWLAEGVTLPFARAADTFDQGVIDGIVDGVSSVSLFSGRRIKRIQTGIVTNYAALLALGLIGLLVVLAVTGGWFA